MPNDLPDFTTQTSQTSVTANDVTIVEGQSGTSVSMDTPPVLLATYKVTGTGFAVGGTVNLPANATGILVLGYETNPANLTIQIQGGQSFYSYASKTVGISGGLVFGAIPASADNPISVTVSNDISMTPGTTVAQVYALIGTGMQLIYAPSTEPLNVGGNATSGAVPVAGVIGGTPQPVVITADANTDAVQIANFNSSIAPGSSVEIIAAPGAGKAIRVLGWDVTYAPNAVATGFYIGYLSDDLTGRMANGQCRVLTAVGDAQVNVSNHIPSGIVLTTNRHLQVYADGGSSGNVNCVGSVYYVVH